MPPDRDVCIRSHGRATVELLDAVQYPQDPSRPGTEGGVMQAVYALHGAKTLLIVAHRLSTVARCDRSCRLESGRIVEQGEAQVILEIVAQPGR